MRVFTTLAVLALGAGLAGQAHTREKPKPGPEKLAWKFTTGDKIYVEEKVTVKSTVTVMGMEEEKEEIQTTVVSFLVKEKTPEGVVLVQTIENMTTKTIKGKADPKQQGIHDKMRGA